MRRRMLLKSSTCGYFTDIVGLLAPACGEPEIVRTIAGKAEGIAVWQGEAEEGKGRGRKGIANEGVGAAAGKPDGAIRHGDDAVQIFGVAQNGRHAQFEYIAGFGIDHAQLAELEFRKPDTALRIARHCINLFL